MRSRSLLCLSSLLLLLNPIQALVLPARNEYHSYLLPIEIDSAYQNRLGVDHEYIMASQTGDRPNYQEYLYLSLTPKSHPDSPVTFKFDLSSAVTTDPNGSLLRPITYSVPNGDLVLDANGKHKLDPQSLLLKVLYDINAEIRYIFIESSQFKPHSPKNENDKKKKKNKNNNDDSVVRSPVFNTHIQLIDPSADSSRINSITLDQIIIEYYSVPQSTRKSQYLTHRLYAFILDYCNSFFIWWGSLVFILLLWSVASVILAYLLINVTTKFRRGATTRLPRDHKVYQSDLEKGSTSSISSGVSTKI